MRVGRWVIAAVVLAVMAGCGSRAPGPYNPEVTGVIDATEPGGPSITRYVLEDGATFDANILNSSATTIVYRAGNNGDVIGDLLLGGSIDDHPWVAFLAPDGGSDLPDECYALYGPATDEGDTILFDIGIRLPKAPAFDAGFLGNPYEQPYPGRRYDAPLQTFCVNREGLVFLRNA